MKDDPLGRKQSEEEFSVARIRRSHFLTRMLVREVRVSQRRSPKEKDGYLIVIRLNELLYAFLGTLYIKA